MTTARYSSSFAPGFDLERERAARIAAAPPPRITAPDLYPDARPPLEALRAEGYRVGLAGNQPADTERIPREMGQPVDYIATSAGWGMEKRSPAFFARLIQEAGLPPDEIAYAGDRLDNDIIPARAAGMLTIFLRRGPWGYIHAQRDQVSQADIRLKSLLALPASLKRFNQPHEA